MKNLAQGTKPQPTHTAAPAETTSAHVPTRPTRPVSMAPTIQTTLADTTTVAGTPGRLSGQQGGRFGWNSTGLVIERSQVPYRAGMEGEISSPRYIFCADSYSVSVPSRVTTVACKRSRSYRQKYKWQVTATYTNTLKPTKSEWADKAAQGYVGAYLGNELTRNCRTLVRSYHSSLNCCGLVLGLRSGFCVRQLVPT